MSMNRAKANIDIYNPASAYAQPSSPQDMINMSLALYTLKKSQYNLRKERYDSTLRIVEQQPAYLENNFLLLNNSFTILSTQNIGDSNTRRDVLTAIMREVLNLREAINRYQRDKLELNVERVAIERMRLELDRSYDQLQQAQRLQAHVLLRELQVTRQQAQPQTQSDAPVNTAAGSGSASNSSSSSSSSSSSLSLNQLSSGFTPSPTEMLSALSLLELSLTSYSQSTAVNTLFFQAQTAAAATASNVGQQDSEPNSPQAPPPSPV